MGRALLLPVKTGKHACAQCDRKAPYAPSVAAKT